MTRPIEGETLEQFLARPEVIARMEAERSPVAFVDRQIDQLKQTTGVLDASDWRVIGYIRRGVVQAMATLDDANASEDARRQASMTLARSMFDFGVITRWVEQELWTRKALKKRAQSQTSEASKERARRRSPLIKARRDQILALCAEWSVPVDWPGIAEELARELGASVVTIYADIGAIVSASNDP